MYAAIFDKRADCFGACCMHAVREELFTHCIAVHA
jgi:hypothetical protein